MFENMVKSAALPMILELLHAAHDGMATTADAVSEQPHEGAFEDAIRQVKLETYNEVIGMIANVIKELDETHQQVHGTPAPRPKTNFNNG